MVNPRSWLKEENKNTKFLHKMASCRTKINSTNKLKVWNKVSEREEEIKETVVELGLYIECWEKRPKADGLQRPCILDWSIRQIGWKALQRRSEKGVDLCRR